MTNKYQVTIIRKLHSWINGTLTKEVVATYRNLSLNDAREKCGKIAQWVDDNTHPELVGYEAHIEAEKKR